MTRSPSAVTASAGASARGRSVAVIGAGISGLACARQLADAGCAVTVFDKGRGLGGRLATRRVDGLQFDHGAQYATARDVAFRDALDVLADAATVAPWHAAWAMLGEAGVSRAAPSETRWVGTPGMSALVRPLAYGLDVRRATRIAALAHDDDEGWLLTDGDAVAHGPYDRLVITAPAPQARELLGPYARRFPQMDGVRYAPCWAVMAAWNQPLPLPFDGAWVEDAVLGLAARDASKPERPPGSPDCWVLHATPAWSRGTLEDPPDAVAARVLDRFLALTGVSESVMHLSAHRWRHALVEQAAGVPYLIDPALGLALAGDWCLGPRIELAFLSGHHLGGALAEDLADAA